MPRKALCRRGSGLCRAAWVLAGCLLGLASPASAAISLTCGETVSGTIATSGQEVEYTFQAVPGDAVHVAALKTSGTLYVSTALYGPGGGELTHWSTDPSLFLLEESGTYRLVVSGGYGGGIGGFLLNLQFTTGKCSKATLSCGQTQNGDLTEFGRDAFSFRANDKDAIVLSVHASGASSLLEAEAVLYDPEGKPVAELSGFSWSNAESRYVAAQTGTYTLLVRDGSSERVNTGDFNVHLQFVNASAGCGSALGCGQTPEGTASVRGQIGAYRFTADAGSVLTLVTKPLSGAISPRLWVYGPTGTKLSGVFDSAFSFELPASGTYTALVGDLDWTAPSTGTYSLSTSCASAPTDFFAVAPCRVVDTRDAALGGTSPVAAGTGSTFTIGGKCGIPTTAKAVSMNVTVTGPSGPGDLRFYPAGASLPLVSLVNYSAGQTRANNGLVALGTGGGVVVHCDQASGGVHVIMDVNGYFP